MDASFVQTDFRGGEWSPYAQGRMDDREYPRGLNVCLNSFPIEEGAWTRRSGTRWMAQTANGAYAWLIPFHFSGNAPYVMELTDSAIRFYSGPQLVLTSDTQQVVSVSAGNPCAVVTYSVHGWTTGDIVQFLFPATGADNTTGSAVAGQQFAITTTGTSSFTLANPVTGTGLDGSTFSVPAGTSIGRVLKVTSPYTLTQLSSVRQVQAEILTTNVLTGQVVLLHNAVAPQVVVNSTPENNGAFAQFTLSAVTFKDGPYLDPPNTGTITPSGLSGSINLTGAPVNTFASTDVGRMIRLFSEPAAWAAGTAYAVGNVVKYTDGNYYTALAAGTGKTPSTSPTFWAINTTAAVWAWGTITVYTSPTAVTITVDPGQALLYTTPISTWRLGLYSATTGYPTNGVFHEGRLWLAGAQPNRIDGSNSNDPFNMAPTAHDGTVGDANAISYVFNSDDTNPIVWMIPGHSGIICGTLGGEWLVAASQLSDPLTPTSIQAHRTSTYKTAAILPVNTGFSTLFVQAAGHRLIEYVADAYSQKFLGRNMSERGRHLSSSGIAQLAYQRDLTPTVWALMNDGSLASLLYKRESSFTSEGPTFAGWARHTLGSGCIIESIAAGPNATGSLDTLVLSVVDPATGMRHVEMMGDLFDETNTIDQGWFVDGGLAPSAVIQDTTVTPNTLKLTGFYPYIGKSVTVSVGGIDVGDFVVATDGSITVQMIGLLTPAYVAAYQGKHTTPWDTAAVVKNTVVNPGFSIQSFVNTSIVTGNEDNTDFVYDPARDRFIICSIGSGATNGLLVFKASTGAFLGGITSPALFATGKRIRNFDPTTNQVSGPFVIDTNGYLIFPSSATSNQSPLVKVDISNPANIVIQDILGLFGTGLTSSANKLTSPQAMCAVNAGDQTYLVLAGNVASTGIQVVQTNSHQKLPYPGYMLNCMPNGAYIPAEDGVDCCAGTQIQNGKASIAIAYILGHKNNGLASTANINLYQMKLPAQNSAGSLPVPTFTQIGTGLAPSAIDPAWSHFTVVEGPVFDKTDGNVIIWAQTNDAVVHTLYVVKISTSTGQVLWATSVADRPNGRPGLNCTNIQNSTLLWSAASKVYTCTTTTGVTTSQTITGLTATSPCCSDDSNGSIFAFGAYTGGGGSPAPLNGTVTGTFWYRLQGTGATAATAKVLFNMPNIPAMAGFTYTSQGQLLRPIAQQVTGARNGPGFAKTRRTHKIGAQFANTQSISVGTAFDNVHLHPVEFRPNTVTDLPLTTLFTGTVRTEVDCDYDFDSMICWQVARPYPATVTAMGGFLSTQDV